jgi:hypothetical protein
MLFGRLVGSKEALITTRMESGGRTTHNCCRERSAKRSQRGRAKRRAATASVLAGGAEEAFRKYSGLPTRPSGTREPPLPLDYPWECSLAAYAVAAAP